MKRLVAVGVALSSLFLLQGTAWAVHGVITDFDIDTTILQANGDVFVSGTITCTNNPNALYRVGVKLDQPGVDDGQGRTQGNCTGTSDRFSVLVQGDFQSSPPDADFEATAQTGDQTNQAVLDQATDTGTVSL